MIVDGGPVETLERQLVAIDVAQSREYEYEENSEPSPVTINRISLYKIRSGRRSRNEDS